MQIKPKNWNQFQHYKDRCPPWIKLHRDLLNNRDFMRLPLASKALAPMLWLLASESKDGLFDGSLDELVFRLHITEKEYNDGIKPLILKGFFIVESEVLAERLQVATPETERETKTEAKKERKKEASTIVECPSFVSVTVWHDFLRMRKTMNKPFSETALKLIIHEAEKAGWSLENALAECCARGWQSFKADWVKDKTLSKTGQTNQTVMSGLTRGLVGGVSNVKLLSR